MSRSGYTDDPNNWAMIKWRGRVASAIRGKRGQQLLRELAAAMDAMPVKELVTNDLQRDGGYCALGVVGAARGVDLASIDTEDPEQLSRAFNIAEPMAQEIEYINDECGNDYKNVNGKWVHAPETPEERWQRVRKWVAEQIKPSHTGDRD